MGYRFRGRKAAIVDRVLTGEARRYDASGMGGAKKSVFAVGARRARQDPAMRVEASRLLPSGAVTEERRSDIREILGTDLVLLPPGVGVVDIAAKCRTAVLVLLESAHVPWGKADLAEWLTGPYRETTSFASSREPAPSLAPPSLGAPSSRRGPVREQRIEEVLRETRAAAVDGFKRIAGEHPDLSFSYGVVYGRAVERCRDETGATGWLPVDRPGAKLSDRVLALIAADYFVRPADYLCLLAVCEMCERVTFDARSKARRACPLHRPSAPAMQRTIA
jgi:hypothetical protein